MRLICPSCGAQYEVDADLIPPAGRDVQCSACGHVWFEAPGMSAAAEDGEAEVDTAPGGSVDAPEPEPEPEPELPATLAEAVPPAAPGRIPRRTVTPAIAEILREEAEREKAAREVEARAALERQEELPLPEPEAGVAAQTLAPPEPEPDPVPEPVADDVAAAVEAMVAQEAARAPEPEPVREPVRPVVAPSLAVPAAAIRAADPPPMPPVREPQASRRDRLPDIEEINSTLSPGGMAQGGDAADEAGKAGGRGFRMGFALVLLVAAGLALAYVYAPRIVVAVPAAEPVMTPYVDAVDGARLWLDLRLQDLLAVMGAGEGGEG